MRSFVALLVIAVGCVRPAPQLPQNAAPAPKPEAKVPNRAAEVCTLGAMKLDAEAKCSMWSGRDTLLPEEVDAVICVSPSWILYCRAPDNDRPEFLPVLEWPAPRAAPAETPAPSAGQNAAVSAPPAPAKKPKKK